MKKLRVGLIGCGVISDVYLNTCQKFDILDIVSCASLNLEESQEKAKKHHIPQVTSVDGVINDPNIDCILNLTIPSAHAEISLAALNAGKHVYSEKPFVTNKADGQKILSLAKEKGLYVGNAPDTFLGGRFQTCLRAIDQGAIDQGIIGKPIGFTAFACHHGVERYHPNPDFYYQIGGGPLLDLGPYYITALITLLGPVKRCSGIAKKSFDKRVIESQPRFGDIMDVEVDTHVCGNLEFVNGAIGSMIMSFDVWDSNLPRMEIYGEKGTISILDPDPTDGANIFSGKVYYKTMETARWKYRPREPGLDEWEEIENIHGYNENENYRGLGLVDMAYAIQNQRPHRANGEMAYHVFDVIDGILSSSQSGLSYNLESSCSIPSPLPENFPANEFSCE